MNIIETFNLISSQHFVYDFSSSITGANDKIPFCSEDQIEQSVSLFTTTRRTNLNNSLPHTNSKHVLKVGKSPCYKNGGRRSGDIMEFVAFLK